MAKNGEGGDELVDNNWKKKGESDHQRDGENENIAGDNS